MIGQSNRQTLPQRAGVRFQCFMLPHCANVASLCRKAEPIGYNLGLGYKSAARSMWAFERRAKEKAAFLSSCAYIAAMLAGVAAALYPSLLPSSGDPARDITIYNAATGEYALRVGLIWWGLGMCLAFGYFVFVYRMFRGKVRLEEGHG